MQSPVAKVWLKVDRAYGLRPADQKEQHQWRPACAVKCRATKCIEMNCEIWARVQRMNDSEYRNTANWKSVSDLLKTEIQLTSKEKD
jgi:hypothetical protein